MFSLKYKTTQFPHLIVVLILLIGFISCDFAYEKHITGKYYIVGVDSKNDLRLCYEMSSGGYIGKAPGQILQYGFNQKFLVAKTQENKDPSYYIIDMTKDSELAHEEQFRIGPIDEDEYDKTWGKRLNITFKRPK